MDNYLTDGKLFGEQIKKGQNLIKKLRMKFHKPKYKDKPQYEVIYKIEGDFQKRFDFMMKDALKDVINIIDETDAKANK